MPAAGDVVHAYSRIAEKNKFLVCVCPDNHWYFFINSKPRTRNPAAQVKIKKGEVGCLEQSSYVDTSKFVHFTEDERQDMEVVGQLNDVVKSRIKNAVDEHDHLPGVHKTTVQDSL